MHPLLFHRRMLFIFVAKGHRMSSGAFVWQWQIDQPLELLCNRGPLTEGTLGSSLFLALRNGMKS